MCNVRMTHYLLSILHIFMLPGTPKSLYFDTLNPASDTLGGRNRQCGNANTQHPATNQPSSPQHVDMSTCCHVDMSTPRITNQYQKIFILTASNHDLGHFGGQKSAMLQWKHPTYRQCGNANTQPPATNQSSNPQLSASSPQLADKVIAVIAREAQFYSTLA